MDRAMLSGITGCGPDPGAGGREMSALPPVMKGSAVMTSDHEMEDFARECVHLANLTADPRMRERLFQMAREWMAMAMHEKKVPEPQFSLAC